MPRPLPLVLLAALAAGCSGETLGEALGFGFDGAGDVIDGEFVVRARLTPEELNALDLHELAWNDALQAGLYSTEGALTLSGLKRALSTGAKGRDVDAENNRPRQAFGVEVNDPYRAYQWNMDMMGAESAWKLATGKGITVAVVDSGVSAAGEDTPLDYVPGYDFVSSDWDPTDLNGHGTHVAGTIAQATGNGKGVVGLAPEATLLGVRALDANGSGSAYGIAYAIQWAADNGADVINLSLGSSYGSDVEKDAIDYAIDRGAVIVAASGNEYVNTVGYPAAYSEVIAVGAVRYDGSVAPYSNGGGGLDVVAPGGDTSVDQNGDGYADGVLQETLDGSSMTYRFFDGTSMATPHVAAVAALLLERGASPYDVQDLLTSTAIDLEGAGWSTRSGWGLVDTVAALEAVDASTSTPPPSTDTEPDEPAADTTAPVISEVGGTRNGASLVLNWTTDEPATTELEFEEYGWFGDESLVTEHEIRFTIDPGATYTFTILATDEAGNTSEDGKWVSGP